MCFCSERVCYSASGIIHIGLYVVGSYMSPCLQSFMRVGLWCSPWWCVVSVVITCFCWNWLLFFFQCFSSLAVCTETRFSLALGSFL